MYRVFPNLLHYKEFVTPSQLGCGNGGLLYVHLCTGMLLVLYVHLCTGMLLVLYVHLCTGMLLVLYVHLCTGMLLV